MLVRVCGDEGAAMMEPATTTPRRRELAPGLRLRLRLLFKEELILP
jgi:hypothetical protein